MRYGAVDVSTRQKLLFPWRKAVFGAAVLLAIGGAVCVVIFSRPSPTELLAHHYGTHDAVGTGFWNRLYSDIDENSAMQPNSHYLRQNGDFPKFIDHLSHHWGDADASSAHGYHHWHEGPLDSGNLDDLRNKAQHIAHHIVIHYKLHPHLDKHHRWHHWSHWYLRCHPVCQKDELWPVEKRLAAKLLYLWDHWHVSAPSFSPPAGTFVEEVTVKIKAASRAEVVHYTTDGTEPTASSPEYLGPIRIGMPGTFEIKAFSQKENMGPSEVVSQTYIVEERCKEPSILPDTDGPFTERVTVSLSSETPGASLQYTTDGTDPSGTWHTEYTKPFTLSVTGSVQVRARSIKKGMAPSLVAEKTYSIEELVDTVTFSPGSSGPFVKKVVISLACSTAGATIHYTLDGSDPKALSSASVKEYTEPLVLTEIGVVTVKAFATHENMAASAVSSHSYTIQGRVKTPIFTPAGGKFVMGANIAISSPTPGAKILYTMDGSIPTLESNVYKAPIHIGAVGTNTIRAFAVKTGMADSAASDATIDILQQVATPTILPNTNGPFTETVSVSLECTTPSATIRYTTDGSLPNENSPKYEGKPFEITVLGKTIVSAYASNENMGDSEVVKQEFDVQGKVDSVTISPPGPGPFVGSVKVEMKSPTPGAKIHFTTDGTEPTASSPLYSAPLVVGPQPRVVVHAIAIEQGMTASDVAQETYTVLAEVGKPEIFPTEEGPFVTEVEVSIQCDTPEGTIHFTTDGSEPSSVSPVYHEPFKVDKVGTETVKAICLKSGMADSEVVEKEIEVIPKAPPPVLTPSSGEFIVSGKIAISSSVDGAVIHYTTDGSAPTAASEVYDGPVEVSKVGMNTVKAVVMKEGMGMSDAAEATVKVIAKLSPPEISPDGGDFRKDELHKGPLISLTAASGATIFFTTDGSEPTEKSIKYDGDPFVMCAQGSHTIKAIATEAGLAPSEASSADFFVKKDKCLATVFNGCPPGSENESKEEEEDVSGCTFY